MRKNIAVVVAVTILALASPVQAKNSVEAKLTFGEGFLGYKALANANLDPGSTWSLDLAYSRGSFSDLNGSFFRDQYFLELSYFSDTSLSLSGNFNHSTDSSGVRALGPGLSLFYTYFDRGTLPEFSSQAGVSAPRSWKLPTDLYTVGVDGLVWFYRASLGTATAVPGISAADGTLTLTQFVPTLFLDAAVVPDRLNLNASASWFLYSNDPTQIATLAGTGLTTTDVAALDALMSGMQWSSWRVGLNATWPSVLEINGGYGRHKQVYPDEWLDGVDLSLSSRLCAWLKVKASWRRTISSFGAGDLYSAAVRVYF